MHAAKAFASEESLQPLDAERTRASLLIVSALPNADEKAVKVARKASTPAV
jgi:hypothetical protein